MTVPVEVSEAPSFSLTTYANELRSPASLERQKALAAAYDAACAALIGPNDEQAEGTRRFKKKSAWRKLARHFNISVDIIRIEREMLDGFFLATVTARAVAPWGQRYEEVGACATSEASGRRVITVADAIATASTRASNRAISNLIAMGEVSAEEIQRQPVKAVAPATQELQWKNKPLSEHPSEALVTLRAWCVKQGKPEEYASKIEAIDALLAARQGE